jgi:putative exporter of polyketide antibiotics
VVLAVTTAIIASGPTGDPSPTSVLDAYRPGLVFAAVVSIVGALVAVLGLVPRREPEVVEELEDAVPEPDLAA